MRAAAGLLIVPAVAAAAAGWWSLVALLPVVLLAIAAPGIRRAAWSTVEPASRAGRFARALTGAAAVTFAVFCATAFGTYVVPSAPGAAAMVFAAAVTAMIAAGGEIPGSWRPWLTGALLLVGAAFVAVCLAIEPAPGPAAGAFAMWGPLLAAVAFLPTLTESGDRHAKPLAPLMGGAAVAAVLAAALYQTGPQRLGLALAPLRTALAAADARTLGTLLAVAATLATVPQAVRSLTDARTAFAGEPGTRNGLPAAIACGAVAVALSGLLTPVSALLLAAAVTLAELVVAVAIVARRKIYLVRRAARR